MAVVVSDTSPVRALAHLGLVDLLDHLFGEVLVPPAVARELESPRPGSPVVVVTAFPFLRVRPPANVARVAELAAVLDPGESEAIALAEELRADELLIDELIGRSHARKLGLPTVGVVGVLLRGKKAGMIPAVGPLVDRLRAELRFFISDQFRADIQRLAGE